VVSARYGYFFNNVQDVATVVRRYSYGNTVNASTVDLAGKSVPRVGIQYFGVRHIRVISPRSSTAYKRKSFNSERLLFPARRRYAYVQGRVLLPAAGK